MKKTGLLLAMVLGLFVLMTGVSNACTLGVTDCRHESPGSTTCYTWECETCGSETCWIFKGTTCTCPSSSQLDPGSIQTAENVVSGVEVSRLEPQTTGTCDCSKCSADQYCCPTANGYCGCFPMPCP
jgi:hypothetical protein